MGATRTPWGTSQTRTVLIPGIVAYTTSSHGGLKLDKDLNQKVPQYMRASDGWYEEDVDWAIVATVFPDAFDDKGREAAKRTLLNWRPWAYEVFYGETIPAGKSYVKEQTRFEYEHKDDLVVIAAWGDWHDQVPTGMVGVVASPGGRRGQRGEKTFLVPEEEYDQKDRFGFVVDPERHQQIPALG